MANANISEIILTDTFNTWVQRHNLVSNTVNVLRNGNYYKDGGSLVLNVATTISDNGTLTLSKTTGTVLSVAGNTAVSGTLFLGSGSLNVASSLANTGNTARVSANGGSTLSLQQINFVNTSTVQVSVSAGAGGASGNANVAFSIVGGSAQGAQGTQGTQGTQGRQGTQGTQGIQGTQGLQGVQGTQGTQGTQGLQGVQGVQGVQGLTGPVAGSSGQVIYNAAGSAGGIPGLTYDSATATTTSSSNVRFTSNIADTPVITVTAATFTATENAAGKVIIMNNQDVADQTITFAPAAYSGFSITVIRAGSKNTTIATSGVTKRNTASFISSNLATSYSAATVLYSATNEIILIGDIT
jgi:Collagen triple helix repeat (20 copies)